MKILLLLNDIFSTGVRKLGSVLAVVLAMGLLLGTSTAQAQNIEPVADAGGPYNNAEVGIPVQFDSSDSSDEDGEIVGWAWQFGPPGDQSFEANPSYTYPNSGDWTVFLTVTDNDGATGVDSIVVEVAPAGSSNEPPVANAGGPYTGEVGEPVLFDSSDSSDDGEIVEYLWNFGDSTPGSSEANPTHIYTKTSTNPFIVSLTVTDDKGKIANSPLTVAVISDTEEGNKAPVAEAGGPYTEVVGSTVAFDGSDSNDPDGTIASYDWDFGDGNTGTGPTPTHVYSSYGTRDVLLKVTDNAGGQAADYADVEILPEDTASDNRVPISVAGGPYFGEVGIPVDFDGSDSYDEDGMIMSYDWSFGDGNTGNGEKPSHTYASSGTYPALLRVTDDKKAQSGDFAKVVIVMNPIDELKELLNQIEGSDFPKGTKNSLEANLKNALKSLEKEKPNSDKVAINELRAFINKINAQITKKIPKGDADELKETAERIMDAIATPL